MEHVKPERLALLVDEPPEPDETAHLESCDRCSLELEALREQTRALGALPELLPPRGDWEELSARLRSEGLLRDPGLLERLGFTKTPNWMRVAASVLLFASGVVTGVGWTGRSPAGAGTGGALPPERLEQAVSAVRTAEQAYVEAMTRYRELAARTGGMPETADPLGRYAALEHLVLVSQAALRQAPEDPFLNGLLTSAIAERDAAARLVSASAEEWF